jgi:urease accessory protein
LLLARSWLPRTEGTVRLGITGRGAASRIGELHQAGAARVRFPRPSAAGIEAVFINTAGGLTGGDRLDIAVALAEGSLALLAGAAAEKIYRARDEEAAEIRVALTLAAGARGVWLPQPTILFDGARLERRTSVALASDASLLALEIVVFGRGAMGEELATGAVADGWRVRRAGELVFADTLRLEGGIAGKHGKAMLDGARAAALLIYAAPDAGARLPEATARVAALSGTAGASAVNGLLLVRALAGDALLLRRDMGALVEWLSARPLPRVWQC